MRSLGTCEKAIGCNRDYDAISWNYNVDSLTLKNGTN